MNKRRKNEFITFVEDSQDDYKSGWYPREVCSHLQQFAIDIEKGLSPRQMVFAPPRSGKSLLSSERLPAWFLGRNPGKNVVVVSYGQHLANTFSRKTRNFVNGDYYKSVFPDFKLNPDRQAVSEWVTINGGCYRSVGVGSGLTGEGADILIIDDIIKDHVEAMNKNLRQKHQDWFETVAQTRLMPGAGILILMTRWHHDDLPGRLIKKMNDDDENIDRYDIRSFKAISDRDEEHRKKGEALHPARYDLKSLERKRKNIERRNWVALYQQSPTDDQGNLFKKNNWRFYETLPSRFELKIQSWDCAFKNTDQSSYVVGYALGKVGADIYIIDRFRKRVDFVQTLDAISEFSSSYSKFRPILIEDKANGPAVISVLKSKMAGIVAIEPKGSKESRAIAITPYHEAGNLLLPEGAPWLDEFMEEFNSFPRGEHDDQVDGLTQGVNWLMSPEERSYFSELDDTFGSPERFVSAPWISPPVFGEKVWSFGVYFDKATSNGAIVALDESGKLRAVQGLNAASPGFTVNVVRLLFNQCQGVDKLVSVYSSDHASTLLNLLGDDIPATISEEKFNDETLFEELRLALVNEKVKLEPVDLLYDHMSLLRCVESDTGKIRFTAPSGLSASAAFALAVAFRHYKGSDVSMRVHTLDNWFENIYED